MKTKIAIIGGGVGGCAAALAALQAGQQVIMTEESDWIGGQFTSQAVPPDEHGWIEKFGCTASYRDFRNRVRDYYRRNFPLTTAAKNDPYLNPGNGWVSPLCHEPRVALAVLEEMLASFVSHGQLIIILNSKPISAFVDHDKILNVQMKELTFGNFFSIEAEYFIDATELGDLLPMAKCEFVTGAESQAQTGEPHAKEKPEPSNSQAFSFCFALDYLKGENHNIRKPKNYEIYRNFIPNLTPAWPGKLLSWEITHPRLMTPLRYHFDPHNESGKAFSGLWSYRRIIDRSQYSSGFYPSDVCLVNWPQMDYLFGDLCTGKESDKKYHLEMARNQSLSLVYWLQREAPRPDGGIGWKGLRLRDDITDSVDGLAKMPYIRESRRIQAEFTIIEQHVSEALRPGKIYGEKYFDSVGIGYYRIDLHPTTGGDNYLDVGSLPFQISLGAMIPKRLENLLPAGKNIGTTHITNGCYRLHPVEWNIGEVAGALAAYCLEKKISPRAVRQNHLEDFQQKLIARGVELAWPENLNLAESDPHRHAM